MVRLLGLRWPVTWISHEIISDTIVDTFFFGIIEQAKHPHHQRLALCQ
ncbi:unnamed protein product [Linum tenue]|uniref:Uncharacterized protein n=1 Tax=Linum tenue TaxID=586396 RepID=A0AAV0GZK3_9ROSI|nr:unnamed protein product [Linum tenue]